MNVLIGLAGLLFLLTANLAAFAACRYVAAAAFGVAEAWRPSRGFSLKDRPVSRWAPPAVAAAGPVGNYLCAAMLIFAGLWIAGEVRHESIVEVIPSRPAAFAGIESGDRILRMNGTPTKTFDEISAFVQSHPTEPIDIVVERGGRELTFKVTPREGRIGIAARELRRVDIGPGEALVRGLKAPALISQEVLLGIRRFLAADTSRTELAGPVGIVTETAAARSKHPIGDALLFLGRLNSFHLWLPVVASLIFVVFGRRRPASTGHVAAATGAPRRPGAPRRGNEDLDL